MVKGTVLPDLKHVYTFSFLVGIVFGLFANVPVLLHQCGPTTALAFE